jgi:protein dithiol oxidoreductase (disulfide-forming)
MLIGALLAASLSFAASARAAEPAAAGKWKAGINYQLLASPQPTSVASGKVEVVEIFWYGCAHCFALDPTLEAWAAAKPANVEFIRIPVIWGPQHRQHAKLFYTLQALHKPELHTEVFETIHGKHVPLMSRNDMEARALHFAFLNAHGVTEKEFDAAYDSMSVASNVLRAEDLTKKYAVGSVPLIIINGKYSTGVTEAGGPAQLVSLINDLAAGEKNR